MKKAIVQFPSDTSYSNNDICGCIYFEQKSRNDCVIVEVNLEGLPPGIHGFHIHEYPIKLEYINQMKLGIVPKDLCKTLGGHFNPYGAVHGSFRYNTQRHAGDLINNLCVNKKKIVNIRFSDTLISLYEGDVNCVINKSIVIHKEQDDEGLPGLIAMRQNKKLNKNEEESLKTGNAGNRIACGNISLI